MQISQVQRSIVDSLPPPCITVDVQQHSQVAAQPRPILRSDVPELGGRKTAYRLLRGSVGKQAVHQSTRIRTVLSPGMLGDFQRQVLVEGLTQTAATVGVTTHDYLVLEGNLEIEVDGTLHRLASGDRLVVPRGLSQRVVTGDPSNSVLVSYIDAATAPTATLLARDHQREIDSDFCGALRQTLPSGLIADVDEVIAEGLTDTVGHTHANFTEDYLVTRGWIRLALHDPKSGAVNVVELNAGDRVIMNPGTGHKVLAGSDDNSILVTCAPGFRPGDESLCEALESFGRARAA